MFKKIVISIVAASLITTPAVAGRFGGSGGFSSSRSSSGSSYRASSYRPAATAPRFSSGSSYNYRPAQTRVVSRPVSYNSAPVNNHYYGNSGGFGGGGGFGSSFGGALTGSMLGNMMFGNHQQTPVYVNNTDGGGYAQDPNQGGYGQQAAPAQDTGPGFFGMIFWGFINLLTLIAIAAALIWIFIKIRNYIRNNK